MNQGLQRERTGDEPAEEEERGQGVPGGTHTAERRAGAVLRLLGAGQAAEQAEHQAEHPHHHQVDGDEALGGTLVQVQGA